jgi:hypothetical protein
MKPKHDATNISVDHVNALFVSLRGEKCRDEPPHRLFGTGLHRVPAQRITG